MAYIFYLLLTLAVLNIVYNLFYISALIFSGVHHSHYLLGYGSGFFTITIRGVTITIGSYIPMIGLSRIYRIENGERHDSFYAWQFHHASKGKRLLVTYSGVIGLLLFSLLVAIAAIYTSSEQYISKDEVNKYGLYPSPAAKAAGFKKGDRILELNGKNVESFYELNQPDVITSQEALYKVLRGDKDTLISLRDIDASSLPTDQYFLEINAPFVVGRVEPASPAEQAGIVRGDRIAKVNGNTIIKHRDMNELFRSDDDGEVSLEVERINEGNPERFFKNVRLNDERRLGIYVEEKITYETKRYSLGNSVALGAEQVWQTLAEQVRGWSRLTGGMKRQVRGPIRISSVFGASLNLNRFFLYLSIFATGVVFLNFLPFPKSALLEVIPLGYEAITRKHFSYKSFRRIRTIAICLVVAVMLWQLVSDIMKLV
jgi:regulator of sigma E protease